MWFKRKAAPAPAVKPVEPSELAYMSAWHFSPAEWDKLTPEQRRDYRDRVSHALTS